MNTTVKKDGSGHYWHLKIVENEKGKYFLHVPMGKKNIELENFKIRLVI